MTGRLKSLPDPPSGPDARCVFVVCTGDSCLKSGARKLLRGLRELRCKAVDVRIASARCLGHCQLAPVMVENGHLLGLMSRRRLHVELIRLGLG